MKKKILCVVLCLALLTAIVPKQKAGADALTATMIGQLAYGIASSWGINFTAGNATGTGVGDFMTGQVENYVNENGGSLGSLFAGEIAIDAASKLVVGQQLYEGVRSFVGWLGEKFGLGENQSTLTQGEVGGKFLPADEKGTGNITGVGAEIKFSGVVNYKDANGNTIQGYGSAVAYYNGEMKSETNSYSCPYTGNFSVYLSGNTLNAAAVRVNPSNGRQVSPVYFLMASVDSVNNQLMWSAPGYTAPQPMPQNKKWEGDFSGTPGFAEPPTDLPDFLSRIPDGIANNDLAVTGAMVDAGGGGGSLPSPSPSPGSSPTYNKGAIATLIAEILALMNSLSGDTAVDQETIDEVAHQVAEQAQTLPDAISQTGTQTQTAIQDATQSMTDTITQTQTQTQTAIQDATQTITDTIKETQTETKDAIQDQTQEITEIKDAIKDATDVPTRDKWEQVKKDLHGVFPFCIPWDIYGMLTAFSAEPRAPHFQWPFNVPSIGLEYTIELDLADFDPVAQTLRTVELIAFSIGLAILTSKVIRW